MIGGQEFLLILLVGLAFFGFGIVATIIRHKHELAKKPETKPAEEKKEDTEVPSSNPQ